MVRGGAEATKQAGARREPRAQEGPVPRWQERDLCAQQHGACAVAHVHAQKTVLVAGRKLRRRTVSSGGDAYTTDEYYG